MTNKSVDNGRGAACAKRADARRNAEAILEAALVSLVRDPEASVAEIALAAGVGRVTLYGHFSSRAHLVDAVFDQAMRQAEAALGERDLSAGDPRQTLADMISSSWEQVARFRTILTAAERELPAERIRAHHDRILDRVRSLIAAGRKVGAFRIDLPESWLVTLFYVTLHAAADEISAGRLSADDAAITITSTLLAAYAPQRKETA